jgi:polar amino acid transport system substrate-binding protein
LISVTEKQFPRAGMKIDKFIVLLLVCMPVFFITGLQAQQELVVRMSENAFPVGFNTPTGWQGMDVDVLEEMSKGSDLQLKVVAMPFKRAMAEVAKGEIDLVANLTKNAERSEDMYWIGPVRNTEVVLVVLKKNQGPAINSFAQLVALLEANHQQIGHVIGVSYSPFLDDNIENNPRLHGQIWNSATRGQIVEMLHKDRIFGFFQDEFEASSLIAASGNDPANPYSGFVIRRSNIDNSISGAYFGVSKHLEQDKLDKLKQGFYRMQHDGSLQNFYDKWAGKAEPKS